MSVAVEGAAQERISRAEALFLHGAAIEVHQLVHAGGQLSDKEAGIKIRAGPWLVNLPVYSPAVIGLENFERIRPAM